MRDSVGSMARNVRTYDHFCVVARALERVGDRWSMLVVRDLLSGPKRFTDLADRLGGITPKTLTQRLRELEEAGLVAVDRQPGRREVRYRLTESGAALRPVVDGLAWWALRHAWRPPGAHEALHSEHLLQAIVVVLDQTGVDHQLSTWSLDLGPDGRYSISCDGAGWRLDSLPASHVPEAPAPDVTVTASRDALRAFVADPSLEVADGLGIRIEGRAAARRRFVRLLGALGDTTRANGQSAMRWASQRKDRG